MNEVALTRYIKDICSENNITNYETFTEVKKMFNKLEGCNVIETQINNKKVIIVIDEKQILIYEYKFGG